MTRMNFVKRWANIKVKVFSTDFEEHKSQFVYDVKSIIEFEDIPVGPNNKLGSYRDQLHLSEQVDRGSGRQQKGSSYRHRR